MKTKVWLEDGKVYVQYAGGEILVNELDNAWLWLIGALYDETPIIIKDERKNLQDHQFNLSCTRFSN